MVFLGVLLVIPAVGVLLAALSWVEVVVDRRLSELPVIREPLAQEPGLAGPPAR